MLVVDPFGDLDGAAEHRLRLLSAAGEDPDRVAILRETLHDRPAQQARCTDDQDSIEHHAILSISSKNMGGRLPEALDPLAEALSGKRPSRLEQSGDVGSEILQPGRHLGQHPPCRQLVGTEHCGRPAVELVEAIDEIHCGLGGMLEDEVKALAPAPDAIP